MNNKPARVVPARHGRSTTGPTDPTVLPAALPQQLIPVQRVAPSVSPPRPTEHPGPANPPQTTPTEVRLWATQTGISVNHCGPVPRLLMAAYLAADRTGKPPSIAEAEKLASAIRLWALQQGNEIPSSEPIPYSIRLQYLAAGGRRSAPVAPRHVPPQAVRRWARSQGIWIAPGSRIPLRVADLYAASHRDPTIPIDASGPHL